MWFDTALRDEESGFYEERLGCVTAPPPTTEPPGHAVGAIPPGARCG